MSVSLDLESEDWALTLSVSPGSTSAFSGSLPFSLPICTKGSMWSRLTPPGCCRPTHPLVRSLIHTVPQVWASKVKCEAEAQFKSVLSSEFMDVMIPDHSFQEKEYRLKESVMH